MKELYPLKFQPILKERIWGGNKLKTSLNKNSELANIGESWEISSVEGEISIVTNGSFRGKSLKELLRQFKSDLIGKKNYKIFKDKFPLLIKFIDANKDLSIQLHPNNELAAKRHNSFGKTEMWYVMQADYEANLIVGFKEQTSKEKYLKHLNSKSLPEILNYEKVKTGDTYFIDVGRVHSIGAGVLLAEIQQTSDITYRLYDWDRLDSEGNSRELHTNLALDAIDFDMSDNFKVDYKDTPNVSNNMVTCPYFTTNFINLSMSIKKTNNLDSFIIYLCVEGELHIETNFRTEKLKLGESILVPAAIENYTLNSSNAKLLEVYV